MQNLLFVSDEIAGQDFISLSTRDHHSWFDMRRQTRVVGMAVTY
jgi:hypothetical protein